MPLRLSCHITQPSKRRLCYYSRILLAKTSVELESGHQLSRIAVTLSSHMPVPWSERLWCLSVLHLASYLALTLHRLKHAHTLSAAHRSAIHNLL